MDFNANPPHITYFLKQTYDYKESMFILVQSSAGLLITAKRIVRRVPLGSSLNEEIYRKEFAEARRKRHKSAGDLLKRKCQVSSS